MNGRRFYPVSEADQIPWLYNYKAKIPTHGPTCGLGTSELASTAYDLTNLIWLLEVWTPAIRQDAKEATAYKNLMFTGSGPTVALPVATVFTSPPTIVTPGALKRLFNQIARMKKAVPGYTVSIGQDLGIIGEEDSTEHPVPEFDLSVEDGVACRCVRINFTKFGHGGVRIESRRGGGAWEFVTVDTLKPYLDERPLLVAGAPEMREYRLRFWDQGEVNGDWSAVQKVTVGV